MQLTQLHCCSTYSSDWHIAPLKQSLNTHKQIKMETFRNAGMKEAERFVFWHRRGNTHNSNNKKKKEFSQETDKRFSLILLGISSNTFYAKRNRLDLAIKFPKSIWEAVRRVIPEGFWWAKHLLIEETGTDQSVSIEAEASWSPFSLKSISLCFPLYIYIYKAFWFFLRHSFISL